MSEARGACSCIGPSLIRRSSARPSPLRGAQRAVPAESARASGRRASGGGGLRRPPRRSWDRADRVLPAARSNRRGARGRQPRPGHRAPAALRRASGLSGGARPGPWRSRSRTSPRSRTRGGPPPRGSTRV